MTAAAARTRPAVAAVLVAAGRGRRMAQVSTGQSAPKQFLQLAGRPILAHTIDRFESTDTIECIVIVVPPGEEQRCRDEMVVPFGFKKVTAIVGGGEERQTSVARGLKVLPEEIEWVAVHDGVRPCVTPRQISAVIDAAITTDGAILAIPLHDTPKQVGADGVIQKTIPRSQIWLAQTPQVFRRAVLQEAHQRADADGVIGTDDAGLMERLGYRVVVVEGSSANVKITTPDDLPIAERWLASPASIEALHGAHRHGV